MIDSSVIPGKTCTMKKISKVTLTEMCSPPDAPFLPISPPQHTCSPTTAPKYPAACGDHRLCAPISKSMPVVPHLITTRTFTLSLITQFKRALSAVAAPTSNCTPDREEGQASNKLSLGGLVSGFYVFHNFWLKRTNIFELLDWDRQQLLNSSTKCTIVPGAGLAFMQS